MRETLSIFFWVFAVAVAVDAVYLYVFKHLMPLGFDTHAYWLAARSAHPYSRAPQTRDAFLYSPVFAEVLRPFAVLPFRGFFALWLVVESTLFAWLVAPLGARWAVPLWLLCVPELIAGNVAGFVALAVVVGVRRPEAWSFPLLTKITPGCLGLVWHAARGQWHAVLRALAATVAVTAVSFVATPHLWFEWGHFLVSNGSGSKGHVALVRAVVGAALVVVGARRGRAWLLAPAVLLATPVLGGLGVLALLTALPRLLGPVPTATTPLPRWVRRGPGTPAVETVGGA